MESLNIFLLGRPGCGKSEVFRRLTARLKEDGITDDFIRADDFPKLWAIFQNDEKTGKWSRCRKTHDGGYKVTDDNVWNDILKEVDRDVVSLQKPGRIVFIEFSRPNYIQSLENFSGGILENSVIIYFDCSFEMCWKRNVARHEAALAKGTDDHLVSREEMEKTYLGDDKDDLLQNKKIPVFVVDTDEEGTDHLKPKVEKLLSGIEKFLKL